MDERANDPTWLYEMYIAKGRALQSIADELHVNRNTIRNRCIKFGIERRKPGENFRGVPKSKTQKQKMSEARKRFWERHPDRDTFKLKLSHSKAKTRISKGHGRRIYVLGRGRMYEHRYVAEQIIGRPLKPDEHVHHIDGNRLNNAPDNLKVVKNLEHQRLHGMKLTETDVLEIRLAWHNKISSQVALAKRFKVSISTISRIIHRKRWKHVHRVFYLQPDQKLSDIEANLMSGDVVYALSNSQPQPSVTLMLLKR